MSRTCAGVGGGRCSPVSRKCAISRKIHGRPCAARPTITASRLRVVEHEARALGRIDIAVGEHRDAHRGLDRRDGLVLGFAQVLVGAGAAVHGQRRDAGSPRRSARSPGHCGCPRFQPVRILSVTGTSTAATTAARIRADQRLVLHQRGAGPDIADLLGRATHVDVDDLRAMVDVVACGLGQHPRIGAGDLHADRRRFVDVIHAVHGFRGVPEPRFGSGHLRHAQAGAHPLAQHAERLVGDTGHRRQHDRNLDPVGADLKGHGKHGGILRGPVLPLT